MSFLLKYNTFTILIINHRNAKVIQLNKLHTFI